MSNTNMNTNNINKAIIDDLKDYYIAESEVSNVNPNDYKFAYDNEHQWLTPTPADNKNPDNTTISTTTTDNANTNANTSTERTTSASITDNEKHNKKTALLALRQCIQSNNGYDNLMNALRVNALNAITPGECMLSLRALQALQIINMIDREITIVDMPTLLLNDDSITNAIADYTIPINTIISMITTEYDKLQSDDFIKNAYEQIDNLINVNKDWIIKNHLLTNNNKTVLLASTASTASNTDNGNDTVSTDAHTDVNTNIDGTDAGTDSTSTLDTVNDATAGTVDDDADTTSDDARIFDTVIKGHGIPWGLITPDKNHVLTYYLSGMNNLPLELELIEDMLTMESSESESETTSTGNNTVLDDNTASTVSTSSERSSAYFTPNRAITPERLECIIGVSGYDYISKHDFTGFIELMALHPSILRIGMNGVLAITANRFDDYNNIDMSELTTRGLDVYNLIASEMQLIPNE
jgi:hypothetical protein